MTTRSMPIEEAADLLARDLTDEPTSPFIAGIDHQIRVGTGVFCTETLTAFIGAGSKRGECFVVER